MTKWRIGSERMRLNALIVEGVCDVTNRFCDLHLPHGTPGFFIRPRQGNVALPRRNGGCRRHLGR